MADEKDFHVIEGGKLIEERTAFQKHLARFERDTPDELDRKGAIYSAGMKASWDFFQFVFGREPTLEEAQLLGTYAALSLAKPDDKAPASSVQDLPTN
jgi:hypothetical protein